MSRVDLDEMLNVTQVADWSAATTAEKL